MPKRGDLISPSWQHEPDPRFVPLTKITNEQKKLLGMRYRKLKKI